VDARWSVTSGVKVTALSCFLLPVVAEIAELASDTCAALASSTPTKNCSAACRSPLCVACLLPASPSFCSDEPELSWEPTLGMEASEPEIPAVVRCAGGGLPKPLGLSRAPLGCGFWKPPPLPFVEMPMPYECSDS